MANAEFEIRKLKTYEINDFIRLLEIFKVVFENEDPLPDKNYLSQLLSKPDFEVFVVCFNGEVAGGLSLYILHGYYSSKPTAYLYDVGILPQHQGKGMGKALMAFVCDYCRNQGFKEAYVEAESDDLGAVQFYRKTSFSTEMNAVHFTYHFKKPRML
jgi:aminoglycoside 3-N-acetyltransferase I